MTLFCFLSHVPTGFDPSKDRVDVLYLIDCVMLSQEN